MQYTGRLFATSIVILFNIFRYFYYHQYLGLPFKPNFFILTMIFLCVAWWCGKQFDRAKYFAEKDTLTNLYNRRSVEKKYAQLSSYCEKRNEKLGIMMIDLNDFKEVNDSLGHHKGDEVLQNFSTFLMKNVYQADIVGRWGGDEFVILIPKAQEDFEGKYMKRFQENMKESNCKIGMSIGSSIHPDHGTSLDMLMRKADSVMYRRKVKRR